MTGDRQAGRGKGAGLREARRIAAILSRAAPRRVILFGSVATGAASAESDIDLCVLVDSYDGRPAFRLEQDFYKLLLAQRYEFPVDVDMRVYTVRDFQDRVERGDPFLRQIASGVVLYERELDAERGDESRF